MLSTGEVDASSRSAAAVVHRHVPAQRASGSQAVVTIRAVTADDHAELAALHADTLEVQYGPEFYRSLLAPSTVAIAALLRDASGDSASSAATIVSRGPERMVGYITARLEARNADCAAQFLAAVRCILSRLACCISDRAQAPAQRACARACSLRDVEEDDVTDICSGESSSLHGYIMTLGVSPSFRGRGVGRALLCVCLRALAGARAAIAAQHPLPASSSMSVTLHALVTNRVAIRMYASAGFARVRVIYGLYTLRTCVDGHTATRTHDAVLMRTRVPVTPASITLPVQPSPERMCVCALRHAFSSPACLVCVDVCAYTHAWTRRRDASPRGAQRAKWADGLPMRSETRIEELPDEHGAV